MPIPFLVIALVSIASGMGAAKGTTKIREIINEGETIDCKCSYCGKKGKHVFYKIDRSWVTGGALGFLSGGIGGSISGFIAKKLYKCNHCGKLIYEDGGKRKWNADTALNNAVRSFTCYPELEDAYEELSNLIERNKVIELKYQKEIEDLKKEINKKNVNQFELEKKVRLLINKIKKDNY